MKVPHRLIMTKTPKEKKSSLDYGDAYFFEGRCWMIVPHRLIVTKTPKQKRVEPRLRGDILCSSGGVR